MTRRAMSYRSAGGFGRVTGEKMSETFDEVDKNIAELEAAAAYSIEAREALAKLEAEAAEIIEVIAKVSEEHGQVELAEAAKASLLKLKPVKGSA